MKFPQAIKEITKHKWNSEESPGCYQTLIWPLCCFIRQTRVFHPKYHKITIAVFKDDFMYEETPIDEKYEIYKFIFRQMKKNQNWTKKKCPISKKKKPLSKKKSK